MKIVTLSENYARDRGILAEHGLSLYIETVNSDGTVNRRVLFDTGQSDVFIKNAQKLKVDLTQVDSVVISHGHYDHAGGLNDFLKINKRAKVYMKMEALQPKFHKGNIFTGFEPDMSLLDGRVEFIDEITNVGDSIFIFPEIKIFNEADTSFSRADSFRDELFVSVIQNSAMTILSSCSHRGISNILRTAQDYFGLPVHSIIGGFHTRDATMERIGLIAEEIRGYFPKSIGICHCTGLEVFSVLKEKIPDTRIYYNYSGKTTII